MDHKINEMEPEDGILKILGYKHEDLAEFNEKLKTLPDYTYIHVLNGCWHGRIETIDGVKSLRVLETMKALPIGDNSDIIYEIYTPYRRTLLNARVEDFYRTFFPEKESEDPVPVYHELNVDELSNIENICKEVLELVEKRKSEMKKKS